MGLGGALYIMEKNMRDEMIIKNTPMIWKVMKDLNCNMTDEEQKEEYYFAGLVGLINGVDTFNPQKGKLSSYLYACIRNGITTCFYQRTMPRRNGQKEISLNIEIEKDTELIDFISSDYNLEEDYIKNELTDILIKCLDKMQNKRNADAVRRYYGIGCKRQNGFEIAELYGVTHQMVHTRVVSGLNCLRRMLERELK